MAKRSFHDTVCRTAMLKLTECFGSRIFVRQEYSGYDSTRHVTYGTDGIADLFGMIRGGELVGGSSLAIPFYVEVKTGAGRLMGGQKSWQDLCARLCCPHYVMRVNQRTDLDEEILSLIRWVEGLS